MRSSRKYGFLIQSHVHFLNPAPLESGCRSVSSPLDMYHSLYTEYHWDIFQKADLGLKVLLFFIYFIILYFILFVNRSNVWKYLCLRYVYVHTGSLTWAPCTISSNMPCNIGVDSRLAPSQWETSLQSNAVSHWLGANLESARKISIGTAV